MFPSFRNLLSNVKFRNEKPLGKIGLALGSGSARGWAHIGVLRALTEEGIKIDYVAGTSIGALVGAFYASGNIDILSDFVLGFDWKQTSSFLDVVVPRSGFIDGKKVSAFLRSHIKEKNIEDLPVEFCAVSTDLYTGKEVLVKQGSLIEAVRASISVPGIFTPAKLNGSFLVDGGIVNPVPVSVVREMGADYVIAVNLSHDLTLGNRLRKNSGVLKNMVENPSQNNTPKHKYKILDALNSRFASMDFSALKQIKSWANTGDTPGIFEILISSINIAEVKITSANFKAYPPDLLIQPALGHVRFLDYDKGRETMEEGYRETKLRLKEL